MKANVSTLLREFPRIRRAALRGEEVVIETREGNLRITAEQSRAEAILGTLRDVVTSCDDTIVEPTTSPSDWNPSA